MQHLAAQSQQQSSRFERQLQRAATNYEAAQAKPMVPAPHCLAPANQRSLLVNSSQQSHQSRAPQSLGGGVRLVDPQHHAFLMNGRQQSSPLELVRKQSTPPGSSLLVQLKREPDAEYAGPAHLTHCQSRAGGGMAPSAGAAELSPASFLAFNPGRENPLFSSSSSSSFKINGDDDDSSQDASAKSSPSANTNHSRIESRSPSDVGGSPASSRSNATSRSSSATPSPAGSRCSSSSEGVARKRGSRARRADGRAPLEEEPDPNCVGIADRWIEDA